MGRPSIAISASTSRGWHYGHSVDSGCAQQGALTLTVGGLGGGSSKSTAPGRGDSTRRTYADTPGAYALTVDRAKRPARAGAQRIKRLRRVVDRSFVATSSLRRHRQETGGLLLDQRVVEL